MPRVWATTKPPRPSTSTTNRPSMAHNSGEPASTECQATPMPSKRKSPCPIMMAGLATTMEGMLSSSETVPRRSQALIPPPPSARVSAGQPQLEPARPPDEDPQDAERRVGDLEQELRLEVEARVRVGQQEPAAHRAQHRKDERSRRGAQPPRAHHPLEDAEEDDEQHEQPMLKHGRLGHARPESLRPDGPRSRIVPDQHEGGHAQEHERPVAGPARPPRRGHAGEHAQ